MIKSFTWAPHYLYCDENDLPNPIELNCECLSGEIYENGMCKQCNNGYVAI